MRKFAIAEAPFARAPGQSGDVFLGDVVDQDDGSPVRVGFGRYAPHQENRETLAFDEATTIVAGRLTVRSAGPGDVIYLARGTAVTYVSRDEGAEPVYVTYPHWRPDQE